MARPISDITQQVRDAFTSVHQAMSTRQVVAVMHARRQIHMGAPAEVELVQTTVKHMLQRGEICRVGAIAEGRRGRPAATYLSVTALQHHLAEQYGTQIPTPCRAMRQAAAIEQLALAWA